jgi:hypothetical protein
MDDSNRILLQLKGGLFAPVGPDQWKMFNDTVKFIEFEYVTGLYIRGFGLIDARGKGWWDISCRYHPSLKVYISHSFFFALTVIRFSLLYTFGDFKFLFPKNILSHEIHGNKFIFPTGLWQRCTYGMLKSVWINDYFILLFSHNSKTITTYIIICEHNAHI